MGRTDLMARDKAHTDVLEAVRARHQDRVSGRSRATAPCGPPLAEAGRPHDGAGSVSVSLARSCAEEVRSSLESSRSRAADRRALSATS